MRNWKPPFIGFIILCLFSITLMADQLPAGSYTKSCNNCHLSNNGLSCKCVDRYGQHHRTRLPTAQGCSFIKNIDGKLVCDSQDTDTLPKGNYQQTCHHCHLHNKLLFCYCQDKQGQSEPSTLHVHASCPPIVNDNGRLKCQHEQPLALPSGNYKQSCRRCEFNGYALRCECRDQKGHWQNTRLKLSPFCPPVYNRNGQLSCN